MPSPLPVRGYRSAVARPPPSATAPPPVTAPPVSRPPGTAADGIPETAPLPAEEQAARAAAGHRAARPRAPRPADRPRRAGPDCISSSAYGTEEMLTQLVPYIGLAAFALVVPITLAILGVLFFVTLSYLDVIQLYTKAGGAYVVARDNFGPKVAQIAAVALLIDYTVTVAVQTAAGTAALTSAIPSLANTTDTVAITVGVVLLLLYGNLRGIREAGQVLRHPDLLLHRLAWASVIIVGYVKEALGDLHHIPHPGPEQALRRAARRTGSRLADGAGLHHRSCARSPTAARRSPASRPSPTGWAASAAPTLAHARQTLVVMSSVLAFLVLGVTLLAHWTHAVPYAGGSPTVVSQEVKAVFGTSPVGTSSSTSCSWPPCSSSTRAATPASTASLPGQLRGRRPLPAPPAHPARPPPGLLQRDPRAGRGRPRAGPRVQGPGQRPGGPLRHRRVHRLHHGRRGHGQAPPHDKAAHWRRGVVDQRVLGLLVRSWSC